MNTPRIETKDTGAWVAQSWVSFFLALGLSTFGIVYLPVNLWIRGFVGIAYLFSIAQAFTLAKTLRDDHESKRILSRIQEAKTAQFLKDYEREAIA